MAQSSQQSAALHNATVAFAQLGSVLQVAQNHTQQAGSLLEQLQNLAGQATEGSSDATLATLDSEFQPILSQLNELTSSASFGGTNLLDGSLSNLPTDPVTADSSPSPQPASGNPLPSLPPLPNLSTQALFGANVPSLLSNASASDALSAINSALAQVNTTQTAIASSQNQVGFASAVADSVFANQVAAQSFLSESDTQTSSSGDLQSLLSSDPSASAQTQTGNLLPGLLALLRD